MIELMSNLRFSELQHHIQLDITCTTIPPASELIYECKVQGSYYHSTSSFETYFLINKIQSW